MAALADFVDEPNHSHASFGIKEAVVNVEQIRVNLRSLLGTSGLFSFDISFELDLELPEILDFLCHRLLIFFEFSAGRVEGVLLLLSLLHQFDLLIFETRNLFTVAFDLFSHCLKLLVLLRLELLGLELENAVTPRLHV